MNDIQRSIAHVHDHLSRSSDVDRFARSGSYLLRLRFADAALADEFLPSFLQAEPGQADLQIAFVSNRDVDLSHLVPQPADVYRAVGKDEWFALWHPGECPMLYLLDRSSNRGLIWLAQGAAPDWVASRPALPIMYAFSVGTPWIVLHAAAIGRNGRTLLLAGEGRVGKTTAAIACARGGWDYAADDYVFVNTATAMVEPLYCSARLRADMAGAFPDLVNESVRQSRSDGDIRHELRLTAALGPDRLRGGLLAAILLPKRGGAPIPEIRAVRRFEAISAMYTSMTLSQLGWSDSMVRKVVATVGLAPVFALDTGQDPALIPQAFGQLLDRL